MAIIFDKIINLIFPKDISVLELEKMTGEEILERLPKAPLDAFGTVALFSYKDRRIKTLINEIKYNQNKILLEKIGVLLAERAMQTFEDTLQFGAHKIHLVPIPTSHSRENTRGYNPPFELAKAIAKNFPESFAVSPILKKIRETKRQALLPRLERLTNLKGAFSVTENAPADQVFIIDDITTTGATILEAKQTLENSKIKVLGAIVIAH